MEQIMNYIKPELAVLPVVLYFLGMALKNAQAVKDKRYPHYAGRCWHRFGGFVGNIDLHHYRMAKCRAGAVYGHCAGCNCGWVQRVCKPDCQTEE